VGSNPTGPTIVISQEIEDTVNLQGVTVFVVWSGVGSRWAGSCGRRDPRRGRPGKTAVASAPANPIAAVAREVGAEADEMIASMNTAVSRPSRPTA
jgi:hypothetical protein